MKKTISVLCAATLFAGAVFAKPTGETEMKEKIICEFLRKNGDVDIYDCFRFVCENDSILKLYYIQKMRDFALDWLLNKADNPEYKIFGSRLHFPMEKVPEVVKAMTDAFYLCNPWEPGKDNGFGVELEDSYFSASLEFADWMPSPYFMDCFFIAQRNFREDEKEIHETITLRWDADTMEKVPLKGTRVMPKSLAALIKGLRDFYNEWQKGHLEFERMK